MPALLLAILCCFPLIENNLAQHIEYKVTYSLINEHSGGVELEKKQFVKYVVDPTLKKIGLYTPDASSLLVMIAAHESQKGHYIVQTTGQAKGVFQMEDATHDYVLAWLKNNRREVYDAVVKMADDEPSAMKMVTDLDYATAMARAFFLRFPEPIPSGASAQAEYAKKRWNTYMGKATPADYLSAYNTWK